MQKMMRKHRCVPLCVCIGAILWFLVFTSSGLVRADTTVRVPPPKGLPKTDATFNFTYSGEVTELTVETPAGTKFTGAPVEAGTISIYIGDAPDGYYVLTIIGSFTTFQVTITGTPVGTTTPSTTATQSAPSPTTAPTTPTTQSTTSPSASGSVVTPAPTQSSTVSTTTTTTTASKPTKAPSPSASEISIDASASITSVLETSTTVSSIQETIVSVITPSLAPVVSEGILTSIPSTPDASLSEASPDENASSVNLQEVLPVILFVFFSLLELCSIVFVGISVYRKRYAIMEYLHEMRLVSQANDLERKRLLLIKKEQRKEKKRDAHQLALQRAEERAAHRIEADRKKEAEAQERQEKDALARLEREEQRKLREAEITRQKEALLQEELEREAPPSKEVSVAAKLMFWKKHKPVSRFYLYQPSDVSIRNTVPVFANYQCALSDDLFWSHDAEMVLEAVRNKMVISSGDVLVMDYETSGAAYRIDAGGLHDCPTFFADHRKSIENA